MNGALAAVLGAGGVALLGASASYVAAVTLFNKVIPRQDGVKVDLNEMADMARWEEYKKIIGPNKEWIMAQELEHITIKSRDGLTLHGDYLPAEGDSDRIAICFHGYTSCGMNDCSSMATFLHSLGFGCIIVDERAHGKSEGDYIGFGILDRYDCLNWVRYAKERFPDSRILLYGVSMGAATVVMASGFEELWDSVSVVISDCAFTSPFAVFSHILKRDYHLPQFPVMNINDRICRKKAGYGFNDYSTLKALSVTKIPVLLIHGEKDNFVPTRMSVENYETGSSPKELLIVENAGHAASYYENRELYESKCREFIDKYMPE